MTFQVSANGSSVQTANGPKSLLNDEQPLTKLDVTNTKSFQTIGVLFNTEPPQPDPGTLISKTLLYASDHPYTYIPATWMEWQNPAPSYPAAPGSGASATTFYTFGDDTANENIPGFGNTTALALFANAQYNAAPTYGTTSTTAFLALEATDTDVSIYLYKVSSGTGTAVGPVFVIGNTVNIRLYVFAEPAITSTY